MSEQEKRELNKRVAVAMGWSGIEDADACIAEMHPFPNSLNLRELCEATASGWFGWSPDAKGPTSVGGVAYEGADKEPTPDFCTDPTAADLVRQEIERRGWLWGMGIAHDGPWGCVNVPLSDSGEFDASNFRGFFRRDISSVVSLLSAFLAAVDAQKAQDEKAQEVTK